MKEFFSAFDLSQIFRASMVLFAVIDIIGSVPIIIKVKEKAGHISPMRISIISFGIMIGFLLLGESILNIFGVDIRSFAVAGSLIIFAIALEMIMGWNLFRDEASAKVASVIPLAFPIIAGAGTLTTLVALKAEFDEINILIGIILNIFVIYTVLRLTKRIELILGEGGIMIVKKVFGIILLAIALKLFSTNITYLFAK